MNKHLSRKTLRHYLENIFENISTGIVFIDPDGKILDFNACFTELTRYSPSTLKRKRISDLIVPEHAAIIEENIRHAIANSISAAFSFRLKAKGNRSFPARATAYGVEIANGRSIIALLVQRYKESKPRKGDAWDSSCQKLLHYISDAVAILTTKNKGQTFILERINTSAERIINRTNQDVRGKNVLEIFSELKEFGLFKVIQEVWKTGKSETFTAHIYKDTNLPCFIIKHIFKTSHDEVIIVFSEAEKQLYSENDLRQYREQILISQKLESIGRFAGGIAHDFNNMLTPILGYTELLLMETDRDSPAYLDLNQIWHSADKARRLVKQLLTFSRKQIFKMEIMNLNDLLIDFKKILESALRENIILEFNLCDDLWNIKADPSQIEQIIMNLALNAQDAMPDGGRLTIETGNIEVDDAFIAQYPSVKRGYYAFVSVSDTGYGMDDETVKQIFEPFFTTKKAGKGTGLGLSTVYGIVKQHHGNITIETYVNKGSTFTILFPRSSDQKTHRSKKFKVGTQVFGTERVLVVEDHEEVRQLICNILQTYGYKVTSSCDAEEAFLIALHAKAPFDLLITDIVMPGINGIELYDKLRKHFPRMKVLYLSGYAHEFKPEEQSGATFLQKPFSIRTLTKTIRKILDG